MPKLCRYGDACTVPKCTMKHPPRNPFEERVIVNAPQNVEEHDVLCEEDAKELASILHADYLRELADEIYWVPWGLEGGEPYVIGPHPELGTFSTWNEAYDSYLACIYQ